jgi:hypothetical protein
MTETIHDMRVGEIWPDAGTLAGIAAIIAAFATAMIFFRVQREIEMAKIDEINWLPWADRMLLAAATIRLLLVLLPLVAAHPSSWTYRFFPGPGCASAIVLVAGYPFALLAHYQLIFSGNRNGPRTNPEPAEALILCLSVLAAIAAAGWAFYLRAVQ